MRRVLKDPIQFNIRIPGELYADLERLARKGKTTMSETVRNGLIQWLKDNGHLPADYTAYVTKSTESGSP